MEKNQLTREWVIEGFDGTTCIFQQTLPSTSWPDVRIITLLQRLVAGRLSENDIVDGTRALRDPFRKPIFHARREFLDGKIAISVGENPFFVATRVRSGHKRRMPTVLYFLAFQDQFRELLSWVSTQIN